MLNLKSLTTAAAAAVTVILAATGIAAPAAAQQTEKPSVATADAQLEDDGTLYIFYRGEVVRDMAGYIERIFKKYEEKSHKVILQLDSPGGDVEGGEQVIHILKRIKQTHRLLTVVMPGRTCASMCVPIFLQGHDRHAARSSLWLFHEAAKPAEGGKVRIDREETLRLFQRYFVPAGVSVDWLNSILPIIRGADLWQTGQDLIGKNTGIVTYAIENQRARAVVAEAPAPKANQSPSTPRPRS